MLDTAPRLTFVRPPALPVERLIVGQGIEEATSLLPRLFNLCRAAQGLAARQAVGLPVDHAARDALLLEIRRDHLMKLCLTWPGQMGMGQLALPRDWQAGGEAVLAALLEQDHAAIRSAQRFESFARGPLGAVLLRLSSLFAPGEGCTPVLPPVTPRTALDPLAAVENTIATRQLAHPVMRDVERRWGCGPLWRATARALDLADTLTGRFLAVTRQMGNAVTVPATRGLYAVRAEVSEGRVTAFSRVTPTDHLLAPGGVLEHALASLPPAKRGLAPLLLDILDPCSPVKLTEARHDA